MTDSTKKEFVPNEFGRRLVTIVAWVAGAFTLVLCVLLIANFDGIESLTILPSNQSAFPVLFGHSPAIVGKFDAIIAPNTFITLMRNNYHRLRLHQFIDFIRSANRIVQREGYLLTPLGFIDRFVIHAECSDL